MHTVACPWQNILTSSSPLQAHLADEKAHMGHMSRLMVITMRRMHEVIAALEEARAGRIGHLWTPHAGNAAAGAMCAATAAEGAAREGRPGAPTSVGWCPHPDAAPPPQGPPAVETPLSDSVLSDMLSARSAFGLHMSQRPAAAASPALKFKWAPTLPLRVYMYMRNAA